MAQSLLILGRQPALGLAELESLFGASAIRQIDGTAALLDIEPAAVRFERLGGSIKCAQVIATIDGTGWRVVEQHLLKTASTFASTLAEGKLQLGLSAYGFNVTPAQMTATGLSVKKAIRKTGRSVRLSPNTEPALSSAQVYHNRLTSAHGWELIIQRDGDKTIFARTTDVQDIDSYAYRDRSRPKRDARVGMLPPKLAQTIINLSAGSQQMLTTLLDPFCGTGVLLQEALLMGYQAYGSDLAPRMVDYSRENLDWLKAKFDIADFTVKLETGDATNHIWQQPIDLVAAEAYLGRPFTATPTPPVLAQTVSECNLIIKKFLVNIHAQLQPGTRLCIAIPAWQTRPDEFQHLPLIDQIEQIGYNRVSFEHARNEDLLYYREDQIVARELLVIIRK